MPIITIKIAGKYISVFSILFGILYGYLLFHTFESKNRASIGNLTNLFLCWFAISIISTLYGLYFFGDLPVWSAKAIAYLPKIMLYLTFLIMISKSINKNEIVSLFFKGFLVGCIINISWAVLEGVVFYVSKYSLNNIIFKNYAKAILPQRPFITIVLPEGIRTPGFNYDPAHLGGIIPICILYSMLNRKYVLFLLALVALIFSQSTTGLLCSFILLFVNYNKFSLRSKDVVNNIKKYYVNIVFAVMIIIVTILLIKDTMFIKSIVINFSGFTKRVSMVYLNSNEPNIRILYIIFVPAAIIYSGANVLIGTGFGTSSYPYVFSETIRIALGNHPIFPYDPENTYISYLFDIGVFGLLIYIIVLVKCYYYFSKQYRNKERSLIFASLGSIILVGLFYHYILTAYQILILIMAVTLIDSQKIIISLK